MKLGDIARSLALENLTPELTEELESELAAGYASDLLSDVLAGAPAGAALVTIQAHLNTVAVALHAHLSAVILAGGHRPEANVVARAVDERIPLFSTKQSTFDVVGALYALGLRGAA
jgi:hypothetical protein